MLVKVADGRVLLEDRDNFRAFKLVIAGDRRMIADVRRVLDHVANLVDEETAWVSADALRQRPEVAGNALWQQNFSAMIEKARPHGWIDDQRNAIKAHVEWLS
jgi:hypothetical protein